MDFEYVPCQQMHGQVAVAAAPPLLFAVAEDLLHGELSRTRQASERDHENPTSVDFFMWPLEEIFFFRLEWAKTSVIKLSSLVIQTTFSGVAGIIFEAGDLHPFWF